MKKLMALALLLCTGGVAVCAQEEARVAAATIHMNENTEPAEVNASEDTDVRGKCSSCSGCKQSSCSSCCRPSNCKPCCRTSEVSADNESTDVTRKCGKCSSCSGCKQSSCCRPSNCKPCKPCCRGAEDTPEE